MNTHKTVAVPEGSTRRLIDTDGLPTAVRDGGDGVPIVWLGGEKAARGWLPVYAELAAEHRIIVPDHPGFGETTLPDHFNDFTDLVRHYDRLFELLDLDTFHLVGNSFGGWIAAEYASFFSRRLRSLTLLAPWGVRSAEHPAPEFFRPSVRAEDRDEFNGTADLYREQLDEPDPDEDKIRGYLELSALARFAWNPRYDLKLEHRLPWLQTPTLVVLPEDDRVVHRSIGERYAALIPGATPRTLSSDGPVPLGHAFVVQAPTAIAAMIAEHVRNTEEGHQR